MTASQEEAFEKVRPQLVRACRGYLGERQVESADLVQDAFMSSWGGMGFEATPEPNFEQLKQVCRQFCGARLRDREGIVRGLEPELEGARRAGKAERVASENLDVQKQQSMSLLREAIKPLSLEGRQMLQLRHVKGLTYAQIGSTLELSWAAVAARLGAARQELSLSILPVEAGPVAASVVRGPWSLVSA